MNARHSLTLLIVALMQKWRARYEPSKHYMRGPGPAAQAYTDHDRSPLRSDRPQTDPEETLT
jgi:hypothetical protein